MRKIVALFALFASCGEFSNDTDSEKEDAQASFERWRDLILAGRMAECVQMMTWSYKSQWLYDRLAEGDSAALDWRAKLAGNARTDLDLWFGEAGKHSARGRVPTLPRTVQSDPTLNPLFIAYYKDAALELSYEFRKVRIVGVSPDERGVTIVVHNSHDDPELYALVIEGGMWKLDHHRTKPPR